MTPDDEVVPLSRTALHAQRLKPAPGLAPVKRVWCHRRRGYIDLFDPRACVPMRERRAASGDGYVALRPACADRTEANEGGGR